MDIRELYADKELIEQVAYNQLRRDNSEQIPVVGSPEIIPDLLMENLIAYQYFFLSGFDKSKTFCMPQIGGAVLSHEDLSHKIFAIDVYSTERVREVREIIMENDYEFDYLTKIIKKVSGRTSERRGGIIALNGNVREEEYDFVTIPNPESVLEYLWPNRGALEESRGDVEIVARSIHAQYYNLFTPYHKNIADVLSQVDVRDPNICKEIVKKFRSQYIPQYFISGFHVSYNEFEMKIQPVITESVWEECKLELPNLEHDISDIKEMGMIYNEHLCSTWPEFLLDNVRFGQVPKFNANEEGDIN